jgi:hypothetical protein
MANSLLITLLFIIGNILFIGLHWFVFNFIAPAALAGTGLLHLISLIYFPYSKISIK